MTPIIESFRLIFLGSGTVHILHIFYSISITLMLLVFGLLIFNKIEQNFMDSLNYAPIKIENVSKYYRLGNDRK